VKWRENSPKKEIKKPVIGSGSYLWLLEETFHCIFYYLDLKDLFILGITSRQFYHATYSYEIGSKIVFNTASSLLTHNVESSVRLTQLLLSGNHVVNRFEDKQTKVLTGKLFNGVYESKIESFLISLKKNNVGTIKICYKCQHNDKKPNIIDPSDNHSIYIENRFLDKM
jgi:hypothetical protein